MPYFTPVIYYIKGEMTADTFNNWILDNGGIVDRLPSVPEPVPSTVFSINDSTISLYLYKARQSSFCNRNNLIFS